MKAKFQPENGFPGSEFSSALSLAANYLPIVCRGDQMGA
jgi:hypothetical protein